MIYVVKFMKMKKLAIGSFACVSANISEPKRTLILEINEKPGPCQEARRRDLQKQQHLVVGGVVIYAQ